MANTTNFNWETPDDTDLVKDGAAAIRTLGSAIDTSLVDLKGGTTGQILSKATNTDMDFTWITNDVGDITAVTAGTGISGGGTTGAVTITNDMATTITASGDIVVGTGSGTYDNLPIGTTGQVLTADTTVSPYKVKWATASSAASFVGCSVYKSSAQTLTNNAETALTFDTENFDTSAFHSTTTNTSRMTIPSGKAGYYLVVTTATFASNSTPARAVTLRKNGSEHAYLQQIQPVSNGGTITNGTYILNLAENDYIEIYVRQESGGNLNTGSGSAGPSFTIQYLGA